MVSSEILSDFYGDTENCIRYWATSACRHRIDGGDGEEIWDNDVDIDVKWHMK